MLPAFPLAPMGENPWGEALRIQRELADVGKHRAASMVDLLLSVVARAQGLTIIHYDNDFDTIANVTGHPAEWVVSAGTV